MITTFRTKGRDHQSGSGGTLFSRRGSPGKQIDQSPKSLKEIVGIVDNIREGGLDNEIRPAMYLPFNQDPDSGFELVVRTTISASDPASLSRQIHEIDPDVVTARPITIEDRIPTPPQPICIARRHGWWVDSRRSR